jgi:AcrR family transcriptional regulator
VPADRGGSRTRARIAQVATELFLARGFDAVTVADVAAAAGVSKVTVFTHFERKEDLLLDELPGALEVIRQTLREREPGLDAITALHRRARELAEQRHVLAGLAGDIQPFLHTVLASPALLARMREFAGVVEHELATELDADFGETAALAAALLFAAYRTVVAETVRRRMAGAAPDTLVAGHLNRLDAAFDAVASGLRPAGS